MDPASVTAAANTAETIAGWFSKAIQYLKPFTPEVKNMVVNYRSGKSEISLLMRVPDSVRRKVHSLEIPAYENFIVHDMVDETFTRVPGAWRLEDGKWKLDTRLLPRCEKFLVLLKGSVPSDALSQLVRIQPATNRDQTEELDRFWLDCMLRNVGILENIWKELNIDEVGVSVNVGIERCFSTTLPKELGERLEATRQLVTAGRGKDRQEMEKAWRRLRRAAQSSEIGVDEIFGVIKNVTGGDFFGKFLTVDQPYRIGDIRREERFSSLFPVQMFVEAATNLGLQRPTARGFLNFQKKSYTDQVKKSLDELGA